MTRAFYGIGSIDQFREVVKLVQLQSEYEGKDERGEPIYNLLRQKPIINFKGTVKIHGTSAAILLTKEDFYTQSKSTVLSTTEDNAGFCNYITSKEQEIKKWIYDCLESEQITFNEYIGIYGEWCGKGIQKGMAINQLDKQFAIFEVKVDGKVINFEFENPTLSIYNVNKALKHNLEIDFNNPSAYLDKLNEIALQAEEECPYGKLFDIKGLGEGYVFTGFWENRVYRFKVKGEKHKMKTKQEKPVELDIEMFNSVDTFLDQNLSLNRLEQGIEILKNENNFKIESIGKYIMWCNTDILKECSLEIETNNLNKKIINKKVSERARKFFLETFYKF